MNLRTAFWTSHWGKVLGREGGETWLSLTLSLAPFTWEGREVPGFGRSAGSFSAPPRPSCASLPPWAGEWEAVGRKAQQPRAAFHQQPSPLPAFAAIPIHSVPRRYYKPTEKLPDIFLF